MQQERRTEFFGCENINPTSIPKQVANGDKSINPDLVKLKESYHKKLQEYEDWYQATGGLEDDTELWNRILELRKQSEAVATVRKDRMFDSQVTPEEQEIIQKRVLLQQLQFQEFEKREQCRKIARVKHVFRYLIKEEIEEAMQETGWCEEQVILNFTQPTYLTEIRKKIALRSKSMYPLTLSAEQQAAYERLLEKRAKKVKNTTDADVKKRSSKYVRLKLDDALEQLEKGEDPEKVFEGWSAARTRAYQQIHTKPNSYYYRFNAPGEKQEHGPWTPQERVLFFKRLDEVGADGQWGIFSMTIPGRVGYQEGGKGTIRVHKPKEPKEPKIKEPKPPKEKPIKDKAKKNSKKRKKKDDDEDDHFDDSGTFKFSSKKNENTIVYDENPLVGFIDPITLEQVIKPAISPYGHVMGYDSWVRCLGAKNICPITKNYLSKRDIVVLTLDNIAEYIEKIVNK